MLLYMNMYDGVGCFRGVAGRPKLGGAALGLLSIVNCLDGHAY